MQVATTTYCRDFGVDRGLIAMCSTRKAQTEAGQEGSVGVPSIRYDLGRRIAIPYS